MKQVVCKRIVSFLLAACMLCSVILTSSAEGTSDKVPEVRGVITNLVTKKFGAIAFEYLERGVLYGMGEAASATQGSGLSEVLSITKRLLGNPQSVALGKITELCKKISAQVSEVQGNIFDTSAYLAAAISQLQSSIDRNNYDGYHNDIVSFYNKYLGVYNDYLTLLNALQAYSESPTDHNFSMLTSAYTQVNDFYQNAADPHTGTEFNFKTDLNNFLLKISPYAATYQVDLAKEPSDASGWGNSTNSTTFLDALYTCTLDGFAFEHQVYANMVAGINEATGYAYTYLTAYRMYVEFGAQTINANPALTEQEKQAQVNSLWNAFADNSFRLMRGIEQMVSLYQEQLSGYMHTYDSEISLKMDYAASRDYKTSGNDYTFTASKTSQFMPVYQVKPVGSSTAFVIRKGNLDKDSSQNNATLTAGDLESYAFYYYYSMFYNNHCYTTNLDFENLRSSAGTTNYKMLTSAEQLAPFYNSRSYASTSGHFVSFLQSQGLTNLPSISENMSGSSYDEDVLKKGNYLIMNNVSWTPVASTVNANSNYDADVHWLNITQPLNAADSSQGMIWLDVEEDIDDNKDTVQKEALVVLSGQPDISLKSSSSGGGSLGLYKAADSSAIGSTVRSGTKLVIKIKPQDGKALKSLQLLDQNGQVLTDLAGNNSVLESDGTHTSDAISTEASLTQVQQDADGNYLFYLSAPYQDATVSASFGDADPSLYTYETVLQASSDGDLQFSSNSGVSERAYAAGTQVELNVRPYSGKLCTGVIATADNGAAIAVADSTVNALRMTPTSKSFTFTMPAQGVRVQAVYTDGYTVNLSAPNAEQGSLAFSSLDCANKDWLKYPVTFAAGETVVLSATPQSGYYTSNFHAVGQGSYNSVSLIPTADGVRFTMPEENVLVSAEFSAITAGAHTVMLTPSDAGWVKFSSLPNGTEMNSIQHAFQPGDTVAFTVGANNPAIVDHVDVVVTEYGGNPVALTKTEDGYSFVMGTRNTTVTATFVTHPTVTLQPCDNGSLSFDPHMTIVGGDASTAYFKAGDRVSIVVEEAAGTTLSELTIQTDSHVTVDAQGDWSTGKGLYTFIMPAENVTVSARFVHYVMATFRYFDEQKQEYVILAVQKILEGQLPNFVSAPEQEGKVFRYWAIGGRQFRWDSTLESSAIVTAVYEDAPIEGQPEIGAATPPANLSTGNPHTGDVSLVIPVALVALLCLIVGVWLLPKKKKSKER